MEIHVEDYRHVLEAEIGRHATHEVVLKIVADVAEWARTNNVRILGNPIGTSIPSYSDSPRVVLLRSLLVEEDFSGVLGRLDSSGYWSETTAMRKCPSLFLRHLTLHELAHLENEWDQSMEDECDTWAFERLFSES